MKAITQKKYGSFDVLKYDEIAKPTPGENEVLVKIFASSINYGNLALVKGKPFIARFWSGLFKPNDKTPGGDIAGKVEAVGSNVTQFAPGDEVYGDTSHCGYGAFAQYACAPADAFALKPTNLTHEETATVPQSGIVALQSVRDNGGIKAGQKILVTGASGGIGTFVVQIAKSYGAEVTAVCSTRNVQKMRSIGADHVIDYTQEDFTRNGKQYDLIIASGGYRSIFDYKRSLTPNGTYVMTGGSMKQIFQALLLGPIISKKGGKTLGNFYHTHSTDDLKFMKTLIEAGKVKPVIDSCYPLHEVAQALQYYEKGHSQGNVVITVEHDAISKVTK